MSHTLYATFAQPEEAERAAGALLDRGARAEDLSVVRHPGEGFSPVTEPRTIATNVAVDPTEGTTVGSMPTGTTVNIDERSGEGTNGRSEPAEKAVQGTIIGASIGAVVAIASLIVPGVGIVLGAGALASAIGGIAATAGIGAATGAFVGYLKEAGLDEETAAEYNDTVESGGAVLAVNVPSGDLDEAAAEAILEEHDATNVNRYANRGYVA